MDKSTLICTRSFYCPNITGTHYAISSGFDTSGAFYNDGNRGPKLVINGEVTYERIGINAGRQNSIYKTQNAIQLPSIKYLIVCRT